jgi:hypothetical protein
MSQLGLSCRRRAQPTTRSISFDGSIKKPPLLGRRLARLYHPSLRLTLANPLCWRLFNIAHPEFDFEHIEAAVDLTLRGTQE